MLPKLLYKIPLFQPKTSAIVPLSFYQRNNPPKGLPVITLENKRKHWYAQQYATSPRPDFLIDKPKMIDHDNGHAITGNGTSREEETKEKLFESVWQDVWETGVLPPRRSYQTYVLKTLPTLTSSSKEPLLRNPYGRISKAAFHQAYDRYKTQLQGLQLMFGRLPALNDTPKMNALKLPVTK
jgi:hypothetical protein